MLDCRKPTREGVLGALTWLIKRGAEYQESLDNMPNQENEIGESIQERIEALEDWQQELDVELPTYGEFIDQEGDDLEKDDWRAHLLDAAREAIDALQEP